MRKKKMFSADVNVIQESRLCVHWIGEKKPTKAQMLEALTNQSDDGGVEDISDDEIIEIKEVLSMDIFSEDDVEEEE